MGQNENCDISPLEYFKPDVYCGKFLQDYGETIFRVYRKYRQSAGYDYYPFEELCQDVVVELMESQKVDFMGHGIVAKITKDKIVDKYRKMISDMSGIANHLNNDTDTELIDEVPSQHLTQLAEAMDEENRRILEEAVHQVCTKRESQVFNLRYKNKKNHTYLEIANRCGISVVSARKRAERARKKVSKYVRENYPEYTN